MGQLVQVQVLFGAPLIIKKETMTLKKLFITILISLLLVSCGSKTPKWDDVKQEYEDLYTTTTNSIQDGRSFSISDIRFCLSTITETLDTLSNKDITNAKTLYENAAKLKAVASMSNSINAKMFIEFGDKLMNLVSSAYNNDSNFKADKQSLLTQLDELNNLDDSVLKDLEIKEKLKWSDIENQFEDAINQFKETMTDKDDVLEHELEEYKDIITNNAAKLERGINTDNLELAKLIYESGYALQVYTEDLIENENIKKVYDLGAHAMEYVKKCAGENISTSYDFFKEIENANKWTLSLWNEIVMKLRLN